MKINVNSFGAIEFEEVYNSVCFKTENGQILAVTMRDGGFEIGLSDLEVKEKSGITLLKWFSANEGQITPLSCQVKS